MTTTRKAGPRQRGFTSTTFGTAMLYLWLATPSVCAAATLQGEVLDESTLTPLYSANLRIDPDSGDSPVVRLITDAHGRFAFPGLPSGCYRLTASFIGYSPEVRDFVCLAEDQTDTITVALVPHAIDMEAMIVSVSRKPEKYEDAPSAAVLVDANEIQSTASFSHAEHLQRLPAVDASKTGINSSNVVVRGFNNVLSTTLLSLVDNRIVQIPSLRVNAYQLSTTIDEDIERLELVLGPGSALYGPNTASGVMHIITKSPFASAGGVASLAGGERDVAQGALRWAGNDGHLLACRVSGQYYRGTDWPHDDPKEPDKIILFRQGPDSSQYDADSIDNKRDLHVEKYSGDVRGDILLGRRGALTLNTGLSQTSNIELTDLGAAQVRDWRFGYVQLRANYGDLFAQAYVNYSDAGDSYLRRSGAKIIDRSRLYVTQLQHAYKPWKFLQLTYGLDAQFTRPETEGTLHGRNEQRDDISNLGGYAQADLRLSSRLEAYAAARLDRNNLLDNPVPSPRLAVSYRADGDQTIRLSYNRAFGTPGTADYFLDILAATVPDTFTALVPYFGSTLMNFRGEGAVDGFRFSRGADSRPEMVSLYGNLLVMDGSASTANAYLAPNVNSVWRGMRLLLVGQYPTLQNVLPDSLSVPVPGVYATVNEAGGFDPVTAASIQDVKPLEETVTSTLEAGYKGRIGKRLAASANVYYTQKTDFVGPFETPHVLVDSSTFVTALRNDIFAKTGDTALARTTAEAVYDSLGALPIGLVSPEGIQNATDVIVTRRNFGNIDLMGLDLAATLHVSSRWNISGTYSYISEDLFRQVGGVSDVATNAPRHKASGIIQYLGSGGVLGGQLHVRWVDGFPVRSGVYVGHVGSYVETNLDLTYRIFKRTQILLSVQNLLDHRHAEFVGAPELGRLARVRVTQQW